MGLEDFEVRGGLDGVRGEMGARLLFGLEGVLFYFVFGVLMFYVIFFFIFVILSDG